MALVVKVKVDAFVKSNLIVMPDTGSSPLQALIRHPETIVFTGYRCLPRTPIRG